eukprot:jgi/Mesvir1/413/Mv11301-RA.2
MVALRHPLRSCPCCYYAYYCCALVLAQLGIGWPYLAAAQAPEDRNIAMPTLFCPCVDRRTTRFSLVFTHVRTQTSTTGGQLRAGVAQAARDRGLQLRAYNYSADADNFTVRGASTFLDAEIQAGTAGIVASLDSDQLTASFIAANAAGIPIYLVGGGDPDLVQSLQRFDSFLGGPIRASIRYIGPDEAALATTLTATLISQGVDHLECIILSLDDSRWPSRCRLAQEAFQEAGRTAEVLPVLSANLDSVVRNILEGHAEHHFAILVEDIATYRSVRASLPAGASITVVVYETSVEVLADIRAGQRVLAVDLAVYTQGYLALALASVEHRNGQMVTSDIETAVTIYGQGAEPATDEALQREVCRAAGNPVCGDPGVLPVTQVQGAPSLGCPCFDREDVQYKVVGAVAKGRLSSYHLYQGMVDAERDLPGSAFRWTLFDSIEIVAQLAEYADAVNSSSCRGVISFDAYVGDLNRPILAAMRSVAAAGKPLYLGYMQTPATSVEAFLDKFKGRLYVGPNVKQSGRAMGLLARQLQGRHMLIHNNLGYATATWEGVKHVMMGYLGETYPFPPNIWDFPPTSHGSAVNRTGAWALFTDLLTNSSAQVMQGLDVNVGEAFIQPLYQRLSEERGGPSPTDTVIYFAVSHFVSAMILPMLSQLAREQPERPPVHAVTHKCTDVEYAALLRWNLTANEELVLGCVDEQLYLSTYLSAMAAALEQQTGERLVGEVRTERLLRYDQLPLNYPRRAACEIYNYEKGYSKGQLGAFNPLCDVRQGCVEAGMSAPSNATPCSGNGACQFPKLASAAGAGGASQGTCLCQRGWTGPFCSERPASWLTSGDRLRHILLVVLLTCVLFPALMVLVFLAYMLRRGRVPSSPEGDRLVAELLRNMSLAAAEATVAVLVMDVDGLADLLAWDSGTTKKALEVFQAVVSRLLPQYHGQQTTATEGAFTLVFHDPVHAVAFAMAVQTNLLHPRHLLKPRMRLSELLKVGRMPSRQEGLIDWPPALLTHEYAAEIRSPGITKSTLDHSHSGNHVPTGGTASHNKDQAVQDEAMPSHSKEHTHSPCILYRGLRVRMGIHVGVPDAPQELPDGRQMYRGEYVDVATALRDIAHGGQVLVSMQAWHMLARHMASTVCHHMGIHTVAEGLPSIHLMQVLPIDLDLRAPFPPLKSVKQLGPSFFDAPAADSYVAGQAPTEPVVMCFMRVAYAKVLRKTPGYQVGAALLVAFVQGRLAEFDAYEVEEKNGNFLLAFRSAAKAVQFGEMVQREAMLLPWSPKLLEEEQAAEIIIKPVLPNAEGGGLTKDQVVFRGLRLQIGMCMGVPSDCQPHMATGRAAYFGPVINRASRIAATAAPGQTLVNKECFLAAKDVCGPSLFRVLGKYKLKGVKEPMRLYQVSSPALSMRLFPRTLKLAKVAGPIVDLDASAPGELENDDAGSGDDAEADGRRLPSTPASTPAATDVENSERGTEGLASQKPGGGLGQGASAVSPSWDPHRIGRMLMSLGGSPQRPSPLGRPSDPYRRSRSRRTTVEEVMSMSRRTTGEEVMSTSRRTTAEEVMSPWPVQAEMSEEDMAYDELLKLAMRQHEKIKALKRWLLERAAEH